MHGVLVPSHLLNTSPRSTARVRLSNSLHTFAFWPMKESHRASYEKLMPFSYFRHQRGLARWTTCRQVLQVLNYEHTTRLQIVSVFLSKFQLYSFMDHFAILHLALKSYKKFANPAKILLKVSCLLPRIDTCQYAQTSKRFWLACP